MRDLLLILHILAAAAWIGATLFYTTAAPALARRAGTRGFLEAVDEIGGKYFGVAVGVLFLSGAGLVSTSDNFGWGSLFVWIGIGVILVDGALDGLVFGKMRKRMMEEDTPAASFASKVRSTIWVSLALYVIALWSMVSKIGA